jgi:hypothetical protein
MVGDGLMEKWMGGVVVTRLSLPRTNTNIPP